MQFEAPESGGIAYICMIKTSIVMAYEHREGQGSLFKNDKQNDRQPDFKGTILIGGTTYEIAAWSRTSQNGREYLSLQAGLPRQNDGQQGGAPQQWGSQQGGYQAPRQQYGQQSGYQAPRPQYGQQTAQPASQQYPQYGQSAPETASYQQYGQNTPPPAAPAPSCDEQPVFEGEDLPF